MDMIRELMSINNIVTLYANDNITANEAVKVMITSNVDIIIIINKNNEPDGIVTMKDILKKSCEERVSLTRLGIVDIMSNPVLTIGEFESIYLAGKIMHQSKIKQLIVVDKDNHVVGILSALEIVKFLARKYVTNYSDNKSLRFALDLC